MTLPRPVFVISLAFAELEEREGLKRAADSPPSSCQAGVCFLANDRKIRFPNFRPESGRLFRVSSVSFKNRKPVVNPIRKKILDTMFGIANG